MIKIRRVAEADSCPQLIQIRDAELARMRRELQAEPLSSRMIQVAYRVAKPALYSMQHHKCCYCERWQDLAYEGTEHYRPKAEAERGDRTDPGYWWLVWSWENLLFVCTQCNSAKNTKFPLEVGCSPLVAEQQPPGNEIPLLLDPCTDDPREHIRFIFVSDACLPVPFNGSRRGREMLTALELFHPSLGARRGGLVSSWRKHIRSLQPALQRVRAALATESAQEIQSAWAAHVIPHLLVSQEFVSLTLDLFDHAFPAALRERWNLTLEALPID